MNSRLFRTIIAALVLACAGRIALTAAQNSEASAMKNPTAATAESIAAGKTVFQRNCAGCHGTDANGGFGNDLIPAAPSLIDETWDHGSTDGDIFNSVKNGIEPDFNMTPFKDQVKDDEIWNVINYIRSIAKKK